MPGRRRAAPAGRRRRPPRRAAAAGRSPAPGPGRARRRGRRAGSRAGSPRARARSGTGCRAAERSRSTSGSRRTGRGSGARSRAWSACEAAALGANPLRLATEGDEGIVGEAVSGDHVVCVPRVARAGVVSSECGSDDARKPLHGRSVITPRRDGPVATRITNEPAAGPSLTAGTQGRNARDTRSLSGVRSLR